jgi:uncharacterized protein
VTAHPDRLCIAFSGSTCIARGSLVDVAAAARKAIAADAQIHVFDAESSKPVELDLRGTSQEVVARYAPTAAPAKRAPGRPKLGVVAREITLLPRHWEWLAEQPGGASVTLRKLVERARKDGSSAENRRRAQDSAFRFMNALAGNEPGFEEATRALYADDAPRFAEITECWPADVRDHARSLAGTAFSAGAPAGSSAGEGAGE